MPLTPQPEDNFDEVEKRFDLKRLKRDLEKRSLRPITDAPWRYFKGVLCVGDPEKVAKRCFKSSGNVRDSLNKYVKPDLLEVLNLPEQRIVWERVAEWLRDAGYGNLDQKPSLPVKWQQVCQRMWNEQKEKQRIRQKVTAKGFEVNVYVGLGLVQRDYQQRRRGNEHERSQIYGLAEEVIIERYPHDKFLTQVIDADSKKHVAMIGEPGAGKTTLLAAIADHLLKSNSTKVPIFLSLAGLQQQTIQSYLIDVWLSKAFRLTMRSEIEASDRESFREWIAQGEAWLLLDGVDEMGEAHPASALHQIKTQLTDWLGQVRVAVTCRLNAWDAQINNPLGGTFDVFKTQDFEPEQVSNFIQQWFSQSRKPDRGEILQAKLTEPQRERIRELMRNPLRLSLLCDVFYTNPDAEFPSTKAGLYEQFVRYFYEWKWSQHPTTEPQRERLNAALGKLAIAGLDDKEGLHRFRLPEKAARQVMGNDEFELAEKLGWLNIVDQDADSAQSVYAFFHPTFQEYFAALVIDDWHFFLNHIPNNPGKGSYRIFELQWREVFLLWLGFKKKNYLEAINFLIDFQDNCKCWSHKLKGFYEYQSYFVALHSIPEIGIGKCAVEIIRRLIDWLPDNENGNSNSCWIFINKKLHSALGELGEDFLLELFNLSFYNSNENHIEKLQYILEIVQSKSAQTKKSYMEQVDLLGNIDKIGKLIQTNSPEGNISFLLSQHIERIGTNNQVLAEKLIGTLEESESRHVRLKAIRALGLITCANSSVLFTLQQELNRSPDIIYLFEVMRSLASVNPNDAKLISILPAIMPKLPIYMRIEASEWLMRDKSFFNDLLFELLNLVENGEDELCYRACQVLIKNIHLIDSSLIVSKLRTYTVDKVFKEDFFRYRDCYEVLWKVSQNMSYPDFYEAWHSPVPDASAFDAVGDEGL